MLFSPLEASLNITYEGTDIKYEGENIKYEGGQTALIKKTFLA